MCVNVFTQIIFIFASYFHLTIYTWDIWRTFVRTFGGHCPDSFGTWLGQGADMDTPWSRFVVDSYTRGVSIVVSVFTRNVDFEPFVAHLEVDICPDIRPIDI